MARGEVKFGIQSWMIRTVQGNQSDAGPCHAWSFKFSPCQAQAAKKRLEIRRKEVLRSDPSLGISDVELAQLPGRVLPKMIGFGWFQSFRWF